MATPAALLNSRLNKFKEELERLGEGVCPDYVIDQIVSEIADANTALGLLQDPSTGNPSSSPIQLPIRYRATGSTDELIGVLDLTRQIVTRLDGTELAIGTGAGQASVLGLANAVTSTTQATPTFLEAQSITVSDNTEKSLPSIPANATQVFIQVEGPSTTQGVLMRTAMGRTPSPTNDWFVNNFDEYSFDTRAEIDGYRFIRASGVTVSFEVRCRYYG